MNPANKSDRVSEAKANLRRAASRVLGHSRAESLDYWQNRILRPCLIRHRGPRYQANRERLLSMITLGYQRTALIIGNGPSMRGAELSWLPDWVDVFTLNRGYLGVDTWGVQPRFHVSVNAHVLQQFGHEMEALSATLFVPWSYVSSGRDDAQLAYFCPVTRPDGRTRRPDHIWIGGTVTHVAMRLASFIGYRRIMLVGVDHRFSTQARPNSLLLAASHDRDHFDRQYFGPGTYWQAPDLRTSELAYRAFRQDFERARGHIIDCTDDGALREFPRLPLREAVSMLAP